MRSISKRILAVTALSTIQAAAAAAQSAAHPLQWFGGCWRRVQGDVVGEERWEAAPDGSITGRAFSQRAGRVTSTEILRVERRGANFVYVASPSGQATAEFPVRTISDTLVVFENPAHDYPQRIIYARRGNDSLRARIEGTVSGRERGSDFPFARSACHEDFAADPDSIILKPLYPMYARLLELSNRNFTGVLDWYVEHAAPDFVSLSWLAPGRQPSLQMLDAIRRAAEARRTPPASMLNLKFAVQVRKGTVRGDTMVVLVVTQQSWDFVDTAGAVGEKGKQHSARTDLHRLDTWIRQAAGWKLTRAESVAREQFQDGQRR